MSEDRSLPDPGEIVVCTVRELTSHGIYVNLDQYDGTNGFLHVSEISTGWVRNIDRVAKVSQKLILKVIRLNRARREIDLSLRQVTNEERRQKVIEWKREERALTIIDAVSKKMGIDDAHVKELRHKLEGEFGTLYAALETAARKGAEGLSGAGLSEEEAEAVAGIAGEKIVPPRYEIGALVEVSSRSPEGIEQVKKTLLAAASAPSAEVHITYAGAPHYRVRITADDYKQAEKAMDVVLDKIKGEVGKHDAFSFKREISRKYGGSS
ncbi:MAG: translation initiation factor IF-2 subunit alpha [Nitrososphaerota archaeon]|jgi:translation initiation factor 2 subunit 1|nr:translation initiation factor IF-2 subunit alpha [Nitrososphaerota archaeon]MDG6953147.1 translation initiation factor IF-2 subunit alpha [Nitrososphaerota archaeon]MDG6956498.1 translation initiation factor IF-2 subunit alpha [Nitrososphaerota archaeon]MDG6960074.1 translation initiation factor IF-2 subunit alpha [Nitrososphaerota archaeon]MDG6965393.1 translation initiation factor IF-2 subunit alpha [Nitrososphaerota archaeon]